MAVAEAFPVSAFIREEMEARGWTTAQLAHDSGTDPPHPRLDGQQGQRAKTQGGKYVSRFAIPVKVSGEVRIVIAMEPERSHRHRTLRVPLGPFSEQEQGAVTMSQAITITDSQKFALGPVTAVDKKGNPAPLGGAVAFASSDTAFLTVTDNGDGTAEAAAVGPLGNAQVTVTDTVDTAVVDVAIIAGAEAGLSITLGTPEEQA